MGQVGSLCNKMEERKAFEKPMLSVGWLFLPHNILRPNVRFFMHCPDDRRTA